MSNQTITGPKETSTTPTPGAFHTLPHEADTSTRTTAETRPSKPRAAKP